jgi:hypothetical protein
MQNAHIPKQSEQIEVHIVTAIWVALMDKSKTLPVLAALLKAAQK